MQRHDLLRAAPDVWADMLTANPALAGLPLVADWAGDGRPVIVRRFGDEDPGGTVLGDAVPVALPLPPSLGKRRIAMRFSAAAALTPVAPVLLREARAQAPDAWQAVIDGLLDLGVDLGCEPRVFGALLWQHLTRLTYLSARSDLDLLWAPRDAAAMATLVERLAVLDVASPVRLDGEIVLPDGGGVNWRELSDSPDMVLVKTLHTVEMRATSRLFA